MTAAIPGSKPSNHIFLTPRVPQGLAAAVEGLTREVIRHRPENIYIFAAHHFEKLLHLREQYDDTAINKNNMKMLHDMNEMIRERHVYLESKDSSDYVQNSGWSLNETAKVLERYRSIFGESNQKITTEEVRELANEQALTTTTATTTTTTTTTISSGSPKKTRQKLSTENKNMTGKYAAASSSRRRESPRVETQDWRSKSKSDIKAAPKIISQIPLAKDIKTELKKNRISSRERKISEEKKIQVSCEYSKETTVEKSTRRSVEKSKRNYEARTEQRRCSQTDDVAKKRIETTQSPQARKSTRSVSMDQVKNYVVQNFVGMTSLEELQTPSYVEKVQEVIDETSLVIKEKVEALKTGIVKASRSKHSKKDNSSSSDEQSKTSAKSTESDKQSPRNVDDIVDKDESESKKSDDTEGSRKSKISLPAVRPPSSKSTSRSLSARSDFDGLVLPPISPESVKSQKVKEELVLPILSPTRSTIASPDVPVSIAVIDNKFPDQMDTNREEEFHDSLNVTPEPRDSDQRPDSLETTEIVDKSDSSGRASPLDVLKDKLLEIEEVQKRIEGVLDNNKVSDENSVYDSTGFALNIQDKLLEIQESEKRIEKILESQSGVVTEQRTDIERKLKELEDAEKRIENIFVSESRRESSNKTDATMVKQTDCTSSTVSIIDNVVVDEVDKESRPKSTTDSSLTSYKKDDKTIPVFANDTQRLSPHSYILTEGSPCEIPDSVTTVIIPDRIPTPDSESLNVEMENDEVYTTLVSSKESNQMQLNEFSNEASEEHASSIHDAFGEIVKDVDEVQTSTVDLEFIHGIKTNHEMIVSRQDLDLIEEERDKEEIIDSEDEKVLRVVTASLEEILDKSEVEYVTKEEIQYVVESVREEEIEEAAFNQTEQAKEISVQDTPVEATEAVGNSLDTEEITARSGESSSGEIKETSATTDRSSLSFDQIGPIVPELNLDSLPDLTISSFNITDDEQKVDQTESKKSSPSDGTLSSERTKAISCDDANFPGDKKMRELEENEELVESDVADKENVAAAVETAENVSNVITECNVEFEKILISSVAVADDGDETSKDIGQSEKISVDDSQALLANAGEESSPDDINKFVCDEKIENKQTIERSAHRHDAAESSSRNIGQQLLIESSSQRTDRLDDLSIKTNVEENKLPINNGSSGCIVKPDEKTTNIEKFFDDVEPSETKKHCCVSLAEKSKNPSSGSSESNESNESNESSESSTFVSAATKIQAGVRGFLTRRRLQSTQRRSSTLDSIPSIQESYAPENLSATHLLPIVESVSSDLRARKKLRREDAVQRTTLSVENAFAENQLQHTGEFHDCIPLPLLDAAGLRALKLAVQKKTDPMNRTNEIDGVDGAQEKNEDTVATNVEHLLGKILLEHAVIPAPTSKLAPFVDVVLLPSNAEAMLQNSYLNFITSVEDVTNELFVEPLMRSGTPKGVIIEEITSLDDAKSVGLPSVDVSEIVSESKKERSEVRANEQELEESSSLREVSITTSEEPLSMNIDEVLGLGDEDASSRKLGQSVGKLGSRDLPVRSSSLSQDSHFSDERLKSPVTMMQIAPGASIEEKSDELTVKEASTTDEKEQESPSEEKSNDAV